MKKLNNYAKEKKYRSELAVASANHNKYSNLLSKLKGVELPDKEFDERLSKFIEAIEKKIDDLSTESRSIMIMLNNKI